jgi:3-hydroxyacyl-CoA dehydrogenase
MAAVNYTKQGSVAVLTVDNPPVNALSQPVRQGLLDGVTAATKDAGVKAIVIACAGRTFIAGADITEFGKPPREPGLFGVLDLMEASTKPIVAAIHGTAFGGGLEVTLCGHYRVAVASAQLGLPEVKLGLLPGAGGTQRLPRLVGAEKALDMITTGNPIRAKEALALGLVDEIIDGDLTAGAVKFAEKVLAENRPLRLVRDRDEKIAAARSKPELFENYRKTLRQRSRGFEAPVANLECVQDAVNLPFEQGMKNERERFVKLMNGAQSKAQRYFFFAEREAAKIPDVPKETAERPIKKAAVIGAGTMGGGIAMNFASAGIPVTVIETAQAALDRGLGICRKNYENTAAKGRLTQAQVEERMGLMTGSLDFGAAADADVIIEAVFEEMPVKQEVFRKLDAVAKPGAILATNTSTLDINIIASATKRPEDVIGLHFFSPANVMRLIEVVRGAKTAKDVIATSMSLSKRIGKVAALVGVCDGFTGNRMLAQRTREASALLLEGASPAQVDKVLYDFGLPMGPFAMGDLAGLDIGWRIRKAKGLKSPVADRLCEAGRFGQKTGAGYYKYEAGNRTPISDPLVDQIIEEVAAAQQVRRRKIDDEEILARCLYPMVNEGAKILEEGLAIRASDIDVIWVYGYGWPVYRGGPMHWAETIGLKKIRDTMEDFRKSHGEQFKLSPLLDRLANEGKTFGAGGG